MLKTQAFAGLGAPVRELHLQERIVPEASGRLRRGDSRRIGILREGKFR